MKKYGFTLVELSVVMVIIGILIGGVLVGKTMIDSARRTSVIADWQKYNTAASNYYTKFGYWPGDDFEALGSSTTNGKWGNATSGDGDGKLNGNEYFEFWQDLALSGFISGTYNGSSDLPTSGFPGSYITHYADTGNTANQAFYINSSKSIGTGTAFAATDAASFGTGTLTGRGALALDTKLDDGVNNTGIVIGLSGTALCDYTSTVIGACNSYYIYKK